jgi:hypothetical protein
MVGLGTEAKGGGVMVVFKKDEMGTVVSKKVVLRTVCFLRRRAGNGIFKKVEGDGSFQEDEEGTVG